MKNFNSKILNLILIIGIVVTIALLVWLPFIVGAFIKVSMISRTGSNTFLILLISGYLLGIPYVIALFKLRRLVSLTMKDEAFSEKSIKILKVISILSFLEIIIFICCSNFMKYNIIEFHDALLVGPTVVIGFICITIGLLFAVLATVFSNARKIKIENDMTI
ncbi:DUF2975 domain-containing protein [uncultured Clostridium sp.]|uniref:DUF2975 domain-containing protein n=1 Tax=uncultured Clostridium sp. TaxID=59620 RepID=UPI00260371D6|nr:DUF2975 domain-containing protein [uncultured Clostridium sp.]